MARPDRLDFFFIARRHASPSSLPNTCATKLTPLQCCRRSRERVRRSAFDVAQPWRRSLPRVGFVVHDGRAKAVPATACDRCIGG
jgi:hypothetical protein